MKIYMPIWEDDPNQSKNPYVFTLIETVKALDSSVTFMFDKNYFFSEDCKNIDIIHFMWPQVMLTGRYSYHDFSLRLYQLKKLGIKVISTCHNFYPHYTSNSDYINIYDLVYSNTDVFIHLGEYSKKEFEKKYINALHYIVPHHVYDTLYPSIPDRLESFKKLQLNPNYIYILCLGAFRDSSEKGIVYHISKFFKGTNIRLIAPALTRYPYFQKNIFKFLYNLFNYFYIKFRYRNIISSGKYVSNEEIPYYYSISDVSLIPRPKILNSGNVTLGYLMSNVVVGPNIGNVGFLLSLFGNPSFDSEDITSVEKSISNGLYLASKGLGKKNREKSIIMFATDLVAKEHLNIYSSLMNS